MNRILLLASIWQGDQRLQIFHLPLWNKPMSLIDNFPRMRSSVGIMLVDDNIISSDYTQQFQNDCKICHSFSIFINRGNRLPFITKVL